MVPTAYRLDAPCMNKRAILLAGGAGTRLYPLTKIVCKQLLPVYDKPMICYPLATLMLGGLREVLIISTPKDLPMLQKSNFAIPGLYVYDDRVVELCRQLKPSARGELEITDLNRVYLEQNQLHVKPLGRGMAWLDTGTQTSLLEAGNYIATIEHRQGLKIACLEEVAFRMNFIDETQLGRIVEQLPKGEYREYLRMVCAEGPAGQHPEPKV